MTKFKPTSLKTPNSIEEVLSILREMEYSARVVAGNTTIHELAYNGVLEDVTTLVDISGLGLNYINAEAGSIHVGAMTTFYDISVSDIFDKKSCYALKEVAQKITTYQIRNMATVGGALASGIPFYDLPVVMLALGANVIVKSSDSTKIIAIDDFFVSNFITSLGPTELITEVQVPVIDSSGSSFVKLGRISNDFAVVNASTLITVDLETKKITGSRIGIGGVSSVPVRHKTAEEYLIGKVVSRGLISDAASIPLDIDIVESVQASIEYKKLVIPVIVRDALLKAVERTGIGEDLK